MNPVVFMAKKSLLLFLLVGFFSLAVSQPGTAPSLQPADLAVQQAETALASATDTASKAQALWTLASASYARGLYKKAESQFWQLSQLAPNFPHRQDVLYQHAVSAFLAGETDPLLRQRAFGSLTALISSLEPEEPQYVQALLLQSWCEVQAGMYEKAQTSLKRASIYAGPDEVSRQNTLCKDIHKGLKADPAECDQKYPVQTAAAGTPGSQTSVSNHAAGGASATVASAVTTNTAAANIAAAGSATETAPVAPAGQNSGSGQVGQAASGSWILQLGAFSVEDNARLLMGDLQKRNIPVEVIQRNPQNSGLFVVQISGFSDREAAMEYGSRVLTPLDLNFQPRKAE